jgi:nicotinamide-nucleotide amidase
MVAPIYTRYTNPVTTILATLGEIQIHLKSVGRDEAEAIGLLDEVAPQLEKILGDYAFSNTGESMEEVVGKLLYSREATVAVAESCTGGLLAQRITSVPGSSSYFLGGVVCYSNTVKSDLLGVSPAALETHGAVSSVVAQGLAEGIRERTGSTFGVGITGIAGPGGATAEKPVGLVYLALAEAKGTQVVEKRYIGDRDTIRWQASQTALDMVRRALMQAVD